MLVNDLLCSLICEPCKIALLPNEAQGHLDCQHGKSQLVIDPTLFNKALEIMGVVDEFPEPGFGGPTCPAFGGLELYKGHRCEECGKALSTKNHCAKHYSEAHPGIKKPKTLPSIHYQHLNKGKGPPRTLFEVLPFDAPDVNSDEMLVMTLRAETDKNFQKRMDPSTLNARGISPWLLSTKWHLHVAGYDPKELMALVTPLHKKDMPRLVSLVHLYYSQATALIDETDELTLQYLNSSDPGKKYVNVYQLTFTSLTINHSYKKWYKQHSISQTPTGWYHHRVHTFSLITVRDVGQTTKKLPGATSSAC